MNPISQYLVTPSLHAATECMVVSAVLNESNQPVSMTLLRARMQPHLSRRNATTLEQKETA
jgi:hypothetical protein